MKRINAILILVVLLLSQVPTSVFAQSDSGTGTTTGSGTTTGTGTTTGGTSGSTSGAGITGGTPLGSVCSIVRMDGDEIHNMYNNLYGRGFQARNRITDPSDNKLLDIFKEPEKEKEKNEKALDAGIGDIPLPTSTQDKAQTTKFKHIQDLDSKSIEGADIVTFRKTNGVTYVYNPEANNRIDSLIEDYSGTEADVEAAREEARDIISEYFIFKIPDSHDKIYTKDMYFNEWKNPQTENMPENFQALIYSNAQKTYDVYLPVFEWGGLFFPTNWISKIGKAKSGLTAFTNLAKARGVTGTHDISYILNEAARLQKEGRHAEAADILRRVQSWITVGERRSGSIDSIDKSFMNAIKEGEEGISSLGASSFSDGLKEIKTQFKTVEDTIKTSEARVVRFLVDAEHKPIGAWDINAYKAYREDVIARATDKKAAIEGLKDLDRAAIDMLSNDIYKKANTVYAIEAYEEGLLGVKGTPAAKENLRKLLEAMGYKSGVGSVDDLARGVTSKELLLERLYSVGVPDESIKIISEAIGSTPVNENLAKSIIQRYYSKFVADTDQIVAETAKWKGTLLMEADAYKADMSSLVAEMNRYGTLTASEEGFLKKYLLRPLTGTQQTGKQTFFRMLYKEGAIYWFAHSPAQYYTTVGEQIEMSYDTKISTQDLGGVNAHLDVLTQDYSYLSGYVQLMSFLGIPEAMKRWMGTISWRMGDMKGKPITVETDIKGCYGDEGRVRDSVWFFSLGEKPFVEKSSEKRDYSLILPGNKNTNTLIQTDAYAHSFVTEDDYNKCGPTIITRTHGLDIMYTEWKTSKEGFIAISKFFEFLSSGDKNTGETTSKGVKIENYVKAKKGEIEESACSDALQWGCWSSQLLPVIDIMLMAECSYRMHSCIDSDYWVHFTKPLGQNEAVENGIIDQIESIVGGQTKEEAAPVETEGGSPFRTVTTEEETREGASLVTGAADEATDSSGEESDVITDDETVSTSKNELDDIIKKLTGVPESLSLKDQAPKQTNNEAIFNMMLWLHGRHQSGLAGALKVHDIGVLHIKPDGGEKPDSGQQGEKNAYIDPASKTLVETDPENNNIAVRLYDPTTGKLNDLFNIGGDPDDFWKARMWLDQPNTGRILPVDALAIKLGSESDAKIFKTVKEGEIYEIAAGGMNGENSEATAIIQCVIDYLNYKTNGDYGWDNFGDALGGFEELTTLEGSIADGKLTGDIKIMSGSAQLTKASEVDIRVNKNAYADNTLLGKADVMQTGFATFMWDHNSNILYVWLHTTYTGMGRGQDFSVDEDSDGDGLSDAQEEALGTSPNDEDTDGDGIPDGYDQDPNNPDDAGEQDVDGDGVPDNVDGEICTVNGIALSLGEEFTNALNLIGPILSIETNQTEVTFIADSTNPDGQCRKYIRICSRLTGECDSEEIADNGINVIDDDVGGGRIIQVQTTENHRKLIKPSMNANGDPTLSMTHYDENGEVVEDGLTTFSDEPVEKIRGSKGFAFYNPETGQWEFYNGLDIPYSTEYNKNGMTYVPNADGSMSAPPINFFAPSTGVKEESVNPIAQLPWSPQEDNLSLLMFIGFLLMATLLLRIKSGDRNGP